MNSLNTFHSDSSRIQTVSRQARIASGSSLWMLAGLLIATLSIQGCNPTGHKDEHSEPFGIELLQSGVTIALQSGSTVVYGDRDHIHRVMGQEFPLVTVRFLDEDGDRFVPDEPEYSLDWTIADGSIISVDQHEEDGKWAFHIDPVGEGMTTIVLKLLHNGHSDFQSLPLMVRVHESTYGQ